MTYPGIPTFPPFAPSDPGNHRPIFDVSDGPDLGEPRGAKYHIFKHDDWMAFLAAMGTEISYPHPLIKLREAEVDDGVVLRKKDIWTADTLDFYARAISRFVAAVRKANGSSGVNDRFLNEQQAIADYFREEADDAQANFDVKFPD